MTPSASIILIFLMGAGARIPFVRCRRFDGRQLTQTMCKQSVSPPAERAVVAPPHHHLACALVLRRLSQTEEFAGSLLRFLQWQRVLLRGPGCLVSDTGIKQTPPLLCLSCLRSKSSCSLCVCWHQSARFHRSKKLITKFPTINTCTALSVNVLLP